jgi:hypothetical protein
MCSYVCNSYNYNQEAFERDLAGIFDHYPSKRQTSRRILQSPRMILWCRNRTNQFWINTIRSVLSMLMLYDEWHLSYTWDNTFTSFLYQRNFPACGFFLLTCLVGLVQPEMENRIYEVFYSWSQFFCLYPPTKPHGYRGLSQDFSFVLVILFIFYLRFNCHSLRPLNHHQH